MGFNKSLTKFITHDMEKGKENVKQIGENLCYHVATHGGLQRSKNEDKMMIFSTVSPIGFESRRNHKMANRRALTSGSPMLLKHNENHLKSLSTKAFREIWSSRKGVKCAFAIICYHLLSFATFFLPFCYICAKSVLPKFFAVLLERKNFLCNN